MKIRVAAVAWKLRSARSDGQYFGHLYDLVSEAHETGADIVVLPELTSLEMLPLAPDLEEKDAPAFLVQFAQGIEEWLLRISASSGMTLVGGSHFRETTDGIVTACVTATPDGKLSATLKNRLTGYERDFWGLKPGQDLAKLPDPRFGALLCFDSGFPEAGTALALSGAEAILVPAFTSTTQGFNRVRDACHAMATDNRVFVVHASLVGSIGYSPAQVSFGSSAILTPGLAPFAPIPVISETPTNEEGIAIADLDFEILAETRCGAHLGVLDEDTDWKIS